MRRTVWITLLLALLPVACGGYPKYVPFSTVDSDPDWSPDGRIIAFTSSRDDGSTGIYVIRPDGHGLRRLFNGTAKEVDWSPDGDRIAFVALGVAPSTRHRAVAAASSCRKLRLRPTATESLTPPSSRVSVRAAPRGVHHG